MSKIKEEAEALRKAQIKHSIIDPNAPVKNWAIRTSSANQRPMVWDDESSDEEDDRSINIKCEEV